MRDQLGRKVTVGPPRLVAKREGDQGNGHYGDVKRYFSADVSGVTLQGVPATHTMLIACSVYYLKYYQQGESGMCVFDETTRRGYTCPAATPESGWQGENEDCRVTDVVPKSS